MNDSMPAAGKSARARFTAALLGLALVAGLAAGLSACRPLYVPLVPDDAPEPVARTRLAADSSLMLNEGRPRLTLTVKELAPEVAFGDWLAVQWFAPSGGIAASESRWVQGDDLGTELAFDLPPDVEVANGEWRAVVSLDGFVLRQFRVDVVVDPEP